MVKVREDFPLHKDGSLNFSQWIDNVGLERDESDIKAIATACWLNLEYASSATTPYQLSCLDQGLQTAEILLHLNIDSDAICAALVYNAVQYAGLSSTLIHEKLSPNVWQIVKGVLKMDAMRSLQSRTDNIQQLSSDQFEKIRKMLIAMVDDVRVVLIKLAEQVVILQGARNIDEDDKIVAAREAERIYAPLANRLGIGQLKWELEDLSFRYLNPKQYKHIATSLDERRLDREKYIAAVKQLLEQEINQASINAEVSARVKHIYSIWRKMHRKSVPFEEIYDVRAVRILVDEIKDCYYALGIVHSLWQHIPKEFDDYIATPKENGYQSLHTAVIGPEGKTLEVQIRTYQMHQESELGVAAHWRYKEGSQVTYSGFDSKMEWLRKLMEWQEDVADASEFADEFRSEVVEDRIYVFTPKGEVVDLPAGSTAVDFAYQVHTEVGNRCNGAKANGRIIPLTYALKTGEQIEILTAKNGKPSRDWLDINRGYVKSNRARTKIHQWFRLQDREKNAAEGHALLEKELSRLGIEHFDEQPLIERFNYHGSEELYAGIGAGDVRLHQVLRLIQNQSKPATQSDEELVASVVKSSKVRPQDEVSSEITVNGVGNLMTHVAACCKPVPGESIIGFITKGKGISVHRVDCHFIGDAQNNRPERLIECEWGETSNLYPVQILIKAIDRKGLLSDITSLLANNNVNVTGVNSMSDKNRENLEMTFNIEVKNLEILGRLFSLIGQLPSIIEVVRRQQ